MTYRLGIDLGTTWTAAAVWRAGTATIFSLGQRRAAIPSVVLLRENGEVLTGDAAVRRAISEPERVVREFKRRIGDTTPIIVGSEAYTAEALSARLLEFVVEQVTMREGEHPSEIIVAHPANWGAYKLDLLRSTIRLAGLDPAACVLIPEPVAAAITYASQERISGGENVCVFDLGGGTFDVAVVQRTQNGFEIVGRPDGLERLGGIDFDAAVFSHVIGTLGPAYTELNPRDPATLTAIARLRQDCIEAKEALSADTDVAIPVLLPNHQTEVRLTRVEFEALIRPSVMDTIHTTARAIESAGLEASDIGRVLLVGGSSRIPLISQLVQGELGISTAVDAHPKHAIAIGTAIRELPSAQPGQPEPSGPTIVVPLTPTPAAPASPDAAPPGKAKLITSPLRPPPGLETPGSAQPGAAQPAPAPPAPPAPVPPAPVPPVTPAPVQHTPPPAPVPVHPPPAPAQPPAAPAASPPAANPAAAGQNPRPPRALPIERPNRPPPPAEHGTGAPPERPPARPQTPAPPIDDAYRTAILDPGQAGQLAAPIEPELATPPEPTRSKASVILVSLLVVGMVLFGAFLLLAQ